MRNKKVKRLTSLALAAILSASSVMPYLAAEPESAVPVEASTEAPAPEAQAPEAEPAETMVGISTESAPAQAQAQETAPEQKEENKEEKKEASSDDEEKKEEEKKEEEKPSYILFLPAVEGVSYNMDDSHVSSEYSTADYTILLYKAGEGVSLGIETEYEVSVINANNDSEFISDSAIKDGHISFTMPEADLTVSFRASEEEPAETELAEEEKQEAESEAPEEAPAQEEAPAPETEAQEAPAPADEFENIASPDTEDGTEADPAQIADPWEEEDTEEVSEQTTESVPEEDAELSTEENGYEDLGVAFDTEEDATEELEDVWEEESEPESESEEEVSVVSDVDMHNIYYEVTEGFSIELENGVATYAEGEEVNFTVTADDDYTLDGVYAVQAYVPEDDPTAPVIMMNESAEITDIQQNDEVTEAEVTFIMPSTDVVLTASALKGYKKEDAKIDNKGIWMIPRTWVPDGMTWYDGTTTIGHTIHRTVTFLGDTRECYCIEPAAGAAGDGTYGNKVKELTTEDAKTGQGTKSAIDGIGNTKAVRLETALFYLYGGPGWEHGGIKDLLKDELANTSSYDAKKQYYTMCHFILSAIYNPNGWNELMSGNVAVNARGVAKINEVIKAIDKLGNPYAAISSSEITATLDAKTGVATSQTVTYTTNVPDNVLYMDGYVVPDNETMVILRGGSTITKKAGSTIGSLKNGDKFYFTKSNYTSASTETIKLKAEICTSYTGYLLDFKSDGTQDMGFSGKPTKGLSLKITWPEANVPGKILIHKSSTDATVGSLHNMKDAVITVYKADGETVQGTITLDEKGEGSLEVPAGDYILKETKAPVCGAYGFLPEEENHASVTVGRGATVEWTLKDPPLYINLPVKKSVTHAVNGREYVDGITFTATNNAKPQITIDAVTDANGEATLEDLFLGTWTITETLSEEAAKYYTTIAPVTVEITRVPDKEELAASRDGVTYAEDYENEEYHNTLAISKIDSETKQYIAGAELQVLDYQKQVVTLKTEDDVTVTTFISSADGPIRFKDVPAGDYFLHEEKGPNGYEVADDIPFSVTNNGEAEATVEMEDRPILKQISVTKIDKKTGKKCGPGFKFDIIAVENIVDGSGHVRKVGDKELTAGTIVETITTGDDSIARSSDLYLGSYKVVESAVNSGLGYTRNTTEYPVELKDSADQPMVIEMIIDNTPNGVKVVKTDALTGKPLEGVTFEILGNGTSIGTFVTDENGEFFHEYLPASTDFIVKEVASIPGYSMTDEEFTFSTDKDGLINGEETVHEIKITNQPNTVQLSKKSAVEGDDGAEVPGATLVITDAEGNEIERWVSGEEPHIVYGLAAGTYTLTETLPPVGYELGESVEFTVTDTNEVQAVVMKDPPYREVEISKQKVAVTEDGEESPELPGAHLELADAEGNVIESWVSTEEPHKVVIPSGVYTLTERKPADGYVTAETITFTVEKRDEEGDYEVQHVVMHDDTTKVHFHKKSFVDGEGGNEIPGATLRITDNNGNLVEEWVSTNEPHIIEMLPIGFYTLTEITAPDGYEKSESVRFEVKDTGEIQHVTMFDAPYRDVEISKKELVKGKGGDEIPGAHLEITTSDGKEVIESWVSTDEPHMVKLPSGSYILTERKPADGYVTAESIAFTVVRREQEGDYEVQPVEMLDDFTKVQITKSDITDGKPVIGAVLIIKDSKGNEVARWTTTAEPHMIEKLPIGTYTLTEITAPDGYDVAETITFEVKDTPEIQKVDMKDAPTPKKTTVNTPQTGDDWNGTPLAVAISLFIVFMAAGVAFLKKKRA